MTSLFLCVSAYAPEWASVQLNLPKTNHFLYKTDIFRDSLFVRCLIPSKRILPINVLKTSNFPTTLMAFISTTNFTFPFQSPLLKQQGTIGNNRLKESVLGLDEKSSIESL